MPDPNMKFMRKVRNRLNSDILRSIDQLRTELAQLQVEQQHLRKMVLDSKNDLGNEIRNAGLIETGQDEILVKLFNGLKIYLDTKDIAVAPHIALDHIWEPAITKAWVSLVGVNDTILDIGANFGYFGLLAAQKTDKKRSKVIFLEANPSLVKYIQKTVSLNWYNEQSIIENVAVSNKDGKVTLNVLNDYIGSSSLKSPTDLNKYLHDKMKISLHEKLIVPAITLDSYCKERAIDSVDLIKMDIEGYEDIAYEGMRGIIKASPSATMFIEFTKEAYKDPRGFYNMLLADFGHVYLIDNSGDIIKPGSTSYESIIAKSEDWVMPIFSKKALV